MSFVHQVRQLSHIDQCLYKSNADLVTFADARDIAATKGILAYIQHGLSNGLPAGNLQVVDQSHGTTLRDFMTGNSQQAWAGDHIMELQLIKQFFSTAQGAIFQVVLNQMLNVSTFFCGYSTRPASCRFNVYGLVL